MIELFSKLKRPFNGIWDAVESNKVAFESILLRLPVKSILIFKSVSKLWYNLMSKKSFILSHRHFSKQNPKFFVFYAPDEDLEDNILHEMHLMEPNGAYTESYTIPIFKTLQLHHPILIASFNGLICFMNDMTPYESSYDMSLHICNPATREVLTLPKSHLSYDIPIFGVLYSNNFHIYKIFKFFSDPVDPEKGYAQCEVYSSKTGEWKLIPRITLRPLINFTLSLASNHVCVNEKLYWFVSQDFDEGFEYPTLILMVDMDDNFHEIEIPNGSETAFLIEFWGRLCFVDWTKSKFYIWLFNEMNEGWCLLEIVKFPVDWMEVAYFDSVAACEDEILFVYKDVKGLRHEILYDVVHSTWKEFRIAEDDKDKAIVVFPFFETLLPCSKYHGKNMFIYLLFIIIFYFRLFLLRHYALKNHAKV